MTRWRGRFGRTMSESASQYRTRMRISYRAFRFICACIFYIYFRGRVYGKPRVPRTGRVLLVSNHQSHVDPVVTTLALPRECHYVARDTLWKNRIFGRLITHLNALPIKRGAADVGALKEIIRRLKADCAVVIFPEGTRTTDGSLGRFHANALAVAKKVGTTIVPVTVCGAYEAMPRGSTIPRPRKIRVAYAEPISPEQVAEWDESRITNTVRERIDANLQRMQHGERPV